MYHNFIFCGENCVFGMADIGVLLVHTDRFSVARDFYRTHNISFRHLPTDVVCVRSVCVVCMHIHICIFSTYVVYMCMCSMYVAYICVCSMCAVCM